MGLAELLAALEDDARAEIDRLDAETREQVEALLADAERRAAEEERALVRDAEARVEAECDAALSRARLEAARIIRDAREALFLEVLDDLRHRLAAVRERDGYRELLRELLDEALSALPRNVLVHVRADERDEALVLDILRQLGRLDVQVSAGLETWGGVEVATDDGRVARNTIEERLANAEPRLRLRLVAALADGVEGATSHGGGAPAGGGAKGGG